MGEVIRSVGELLQRYSFLVSVFGIFGVPNLIYWGYVTSFEFYDLRFFDIYFYTNFQAALLGRFLATFLVAQVFVRVISMQSVLEAPDQPRTDFVAKAILCSAAYPIPLSILLAMLLFVPFYVDFFPGGLLIVGIFIIFGAGLYFSFREFSGGLMNEKGLTVGYVVSLLLFVVSIFVFGIGFERARGVKEGYSESVRIKSSEGPISANVVAVTSNFLLVYDKKCACERALPIGSLRSIELDID